MTEPTKQHRVVVVGGGFGGLEVARELRGAPVDVTLVDRRNFHLFQPLLYQVATGELSPANIAAPLRAIFRRQKNCQVLLGEVTGFDVDRRRVLLRDGELDYDSLVVAAGSTHSYFGHNEWESHAPGLKSVEDATRMRKKILLAFEAAEREPDPERRRAWLTFVLVGGGPTGVELAGALSEIARHTFRKDFRHIDPAEANIIIVEAADKPLHVYSDHLAGKASEALRQLGVEVRTRTKVVDIQEDHVVLESEEGHETLPTRTVLWTAGVAASPLGRLLADATDATTDRIGRVQVEPDLTLPGHPDLFVIGDLAHCADKDGRPLPGLAPVAIQQGSYVADVIASRLQNKPAPPPFTYKDHGSMAVIGRYAAIARVGRFELSGLFAWLLWLMLHLMEITLFQNRLLVLIQWGWAYFFRSRAARLITGPVEPLVETGDASREEVPQTPVEAGS
ncbi:NADH dehydrogenase-like protein [Maioricimonas rarisocia]|uniref:NADH:ubiquinone reductase (non-electrogenic) n=1 Tax=Maioricimonas rarisocia TaxID=2528026 RepID=A0A517Z5Z7_9PLAN|nr:NAD(P)/FAD-dependent oxidoreductase [Maioricimonas rarisocia]QDU37849.1 NADH dehydrogenase-like protein [Maioricimonas rarisocia]